MHDFMTWGYVRQRAEAAAQAVEHAAEAWRELDAARYRGSEHVRVLSWRKDSS